MVIVGGNALRHIEFLTQVDFGTFYIDYDAKTVTFGSNPNGKTVDLTKPKYGIRRTKGTGNDI